MAQKESEMSFCRHPYPTWHAALQLDSFTITGILQTDLQLNQTLLLLKGQGKHLIHKNVVLAQISMDQAAILVQLSHQNDHLCVHALQSRGWHFSVLHCVVQ